MRSMNKSRYFPLALEALVELLPEIEAAEQKALTYVPTLDEVLGKLGVAPDGALFLGMASDGLPVLLNIYDPIPGSILITGAEGVGKTNFLKSLASVTIRMFDPHDLQFGVLTASPQDWAGFEHFEHCATIQPIYENSAMDFLASLNSWAHSNRSKQSFLLLIDGLDKITSWEKQSINDFRWLAMRGPSRRVWPIASINSNLLRTADVLTTEFRTIIYGSTRADVIPTTLTKPLQEELDELNTNNHFLMKEGNDWLKFWVPRLDQGE